MSQQTNDFNLFDPTGVLKTMRDSGVAAWSQAMIQLVNTEAYAEATATMLDAWLASSSPFRKAVEAAMSQALSNLNMPNRGDVIRLAERLTNIEMRLDDLEAKLDDGHHAASSRRARKAGAPEAQP